VAKEKVSRDGKKRQKKKETDKLKTRQGRRKIIQRYFPVYDEDYWTVLNRRRRSGIAVESLKETIVQREADGVLLEEVNLDVDVRKLERMQALRRQRALCRILKRLE
jgi:hypothetical protein